MKNKILLIFICIISISLVSTISLVGCRESNRASIEAESTGTEEKEAAEETQITQEESSNEVVAEEKLKFVLISNTMAGDAFWQVQLKGMETAAEICGVDCVMQFAENDTKKQVDMIESAIAANADGIGVVISDPEAFDEPMQAALDAGIPVITWNVDDPEHEEGNPRIAYSGASDYMIGYLCAQEIAKITPKRKHVAMYIEMPGAGYATQRMAGAKEILDPAGITFSIVDVGYVSPSDAIGKIQAFMQGSPDVDHACPVGAFITEYAMQALDEMDLKEKITNGEMTYGPMEFSTQVAQQLKDGLAVYAHNQQPFSQSFYAVIMLYNYVVNKQIPNDYNTGNIIVTKDNVGFFKLEY